jgi:hypothetical protein
VRRHLAWLVALPLALGASELGHGAATAALGAPAGDGGELFLGRGPGAALLPGALACVLALVLAGLAARVATARGARPPRPPALLPLALLPLAAFALQEQAEWLAAGGRPSLAPLVASTFVAGAALQLPLGLAIALLVRLLLRAADRVAARLRRRLPAVRLRAAEPRRRPEPADLPRPFFLLRSSLGRAPPARPA